MPVTTSAKKALRRDRRRRGVNLKLLSVFKKQVSSFKKKPTPTGLVKAFASIDKALKKKVIHANKAARLKSRLSTLLKAK